MNNKLSTITNLFEGKEIRSIWDSEKEDYYFSVVDVIAALTDATIPRNYWSDLKRKLIDEGSEVHEKIVQLKLKAKDGKMRETDTLDTKGILRLIESIPSPKAEPFKMWLAKLGSDKIDEAFDPSKGIDQMIDFYLKTAGEYKFYKGIRKENLRDNMTDLEVAITNIGELATREIAKNEKPFGLSNNRKVAKRGGGVAKRTKDFFEEETGSKVISKDNSLNYQYLDDDKL